MFQFAKWFLLVVGTITLAGSGAELYVAYVAGRYAAPLYVVMFMASIVTLLGYLVLRREHNT